MNIKNIQYKIDILIKLLAARQFKEVEAMTSARPILGKMSAFEIKNEIEDYEQACGVTLAVDQGDIWSRAFCDYYEDDEPPLIGVDVELLFDYLPNPSDLIISMIVMEKDGVVSLEIHQLRVM